MLAGIQTALFMRSAIDARNLPIQARNSVLELLLISIEEAPYEQHHLHRRFGGRRDRRLVIFWFALNHQQEQSPCV
jgi:hypothetical protein